MNHPHNNSDEEDFGANDFISFPVLPDPETDGNRTLTQLLTTTLRKVTNNASNLVHTYSSPKSRTTSTFLPEEHATIDDVESLTQSIQTHPNQTKGIGGGDPTVVVPEQEGYTPALDTASGSYSSHSPTTILEMSESPPSRHPIRIPTPSNEQQDQADASIHNSTTNTNTNTNTNINNNNNNNNNNPRSIIPIAPSVATVSVSTPIFTNPPLQPGPPPPSSPSPPPPPPQQQPSSPSSPPVASTVAGPSQSLHPAAKANTATVTASEQVGTASIPPTSLQPRVTSDNKGLRIGTPSFSRLPATSVSSTTSVHVLSSNDRSLKPPPIRSPFPKQANSLKISKPNIKKALQNRISSLFTNLPNDIELSDDSASDTESIANDTDQDYINPVINCSFDNNNKQQPTITDSYSSVYSTTASSEPSRGIVNGGGGLADSTDSLSPSLSSFYALREKDLNRQKKGFSASGVPTNLSSAILDNAKSIIANTNLVSSASSVITNKVMEKKKKSMPKKASQNPLKTGGIPRKYWMNDAFVSDCSNCFKPFSAFRRKHHCRFCGQIFCSECTLFISYNQHKAQRRANSNSDEVKKFNDKLRVCKPCYDDVIIYLSDDSSSSSEEEGDSNDGSKEEEHSVLSSTPIEENNVLLSPNGIHVRAQSVNSRNEGWAQANKSFLNHKDGSDSKSILTSPSLRDRKYTTPNNLDGGSILTTSSIRQNNVTLERPKVLPIMTIPATRTGQAVEIPVSQPHSLSFSGIPYSRSSTYMTSLESAPLRDSLPSKSWFRNYARNRNASSPDLSIGGPNNVEGIYHHHPHHPHHNFRAPNTSKYKVCSGSERDLISKKQAFNLDNEDVSDSSSCKDDDYEDDDGRGTESENEDEQAMSMYTSLNHIAPNNNDPICAVMSNSTTVVPTLGEFPTMIVNDKLFGRRFAKIVTPNFGANDEDKGHAKGPHNVAFLEDRQPKTGEALRSHERAHKSLLRMRSRRKSKSIRNTSILSPNIYKAPVDTSPDHNLSRNRMSLVLTTSSPTSSIPASPRSNSNVNVGGEVNLSKVLSEDAFSAPESSPITDHQPYHDFYDRTSSSLQIATGNDYSVIESPRHPAVSRYNSNNNNIARLKSNSSDNSFSDTDGQDVSLNISFEGITMMNTSMRETLKSKSILYKEYLDSILLQCFDDCDIKDDIEQWKTTLTKVLGAIENLKLTDTLDFKQYVKVKKILGGSIEQTSVIDGLFMTKDIDSRGMASKISNPKIALVMFPIEYLKQKESFISLRIIKAQQQVYITNLVSRLVSLEPDIIMVGDSVCGYALKLLEEANITVISNTKPQVIERMSRYTKADIFQTVNDLFFKKGSLGTCKQFEIKKYNYQGLVKTLSFFTGNDMSTGFTIALRGGDEDLLASIKYAVETVMMGELNSKLERKWLDDQQMMIYNDEQQDGTVVEVTHRIKEIIGEIELETQVGLNVCDISPESHQLKNYIELFNRRKVSVSPVVKFTLPPVLIHIYHAFVCYYEYFKTNREIQKLTDASQIESHWLQQLNLTFVGGSNVPNRDSEMLEILKFASQRHLYDLKDDYNVRARNWTNCMNSTSYQLYPVFHKNIYVLHSTISLKYSTPCDGPNLVVVDYYSDNDKCFGLFLDQVFHDAKNICDECGELLLNHCKSYCHGNGKLDFLIEMQSQASSSAASSSSGIPGGINGIPNNRRVMWSFCSECNCTTPLTFMSNETYYLSIGKFFELNFWGHNVVNSDYYYHHNSTNGCGHDFFKKYVKCFAMNDMIIKMQYSHLDTYEIVVPKKQVALKCEIDIRLRHESYALIRKKAEAFFRSILNRLEAIKSNEAIDNLDKALPRATTLIGLANSQAQQVYDQLMNIYINSGHTNYMSLNVVLRKLQELGFEWNNTFNEFEKEFIPTENDLARFTQFHIKNFLMDKYNSIDDEQIVKKVEDDHHPVEQKPKEIVDDGEDEGGPSSFDDSHSSLTPTTPRGQQSSNSINPISAPTPRTKSLSKAMGERINHMEQLLKEGSGDSSPLLVSTPNRREGGGDGSSSVTQNRVYELASYFDQMNFDQISQELKKLEKSNFKPIPVGESKPIVEIYNKIEDAVNVDKMEGNNEISRPRVSSHNKTTTKKMPSPFNHVQPRNPNLIHNRQPISPIPEGNSLKAISPNNINVKSEIHGPQPPQENTVSVPNPPASQPQEKQSILKSLTKFWVERASTMWGDQQLEFVLDSTEHTFADSEVIVREDEPSSLIALCLSSSDYRHKMNQMQQTVEGHEPEHGTSNVSANTNNNNNNNNSNNNDTSDNNALGGSNVPDKKAINFAKIEKKFKRRNQLNGVGEELEMVLNTQQSNHLKYQFVDGRTHFSCKVFYSEHFEALRWACGNHESFIQSLSRCVKWKSNGGKSGSNFLKTLDDRYIIKELSKSELDSFVMIAPYYFKYISQSTYNTLTTAIAKIFGFYQVEIRNNDTNKVLFKMDFLIMENLFYDHKLTRIFDLKGSMRNRHVKQTGRENEVLLDENMIEYIYESPVCVKESSKRLMRGALFNDTSFLSAMDVMDYSLVVGIDDTSNKLYIGIIDWLRTFTWDKKVENWVKGNNLMGNKKKGKDPTIVTPKQYRNRFREAMERYILEIPDPWYSS